MRTLYMVLGAALILAGAVELVVVSILAGVMSIALGVVVFSLSSVTDRIDELRARIASLESPKRTETAPRARVESAAAPTAREPSAEEIEAAKAMLASAEFHHFAKRFGDARVLYGQIVDRYPATKQAATARQQLDNLRGA
jgi:hypothetical protein